MSLSLTQTLTAVGPGITSSFLAVGGTAPYTYSVQPGGANGSINSSTGVYTAPQSVGSTPKTRTDTIIVTDNTSATATATITVGTVLHLLCDIIQTYMGIPQGRVYLWDQKLMMPSNTGLWVAVSEVSDKVFGNNKTYDTNGNCISSVNSMAVVDLDIYSRDTSARDQKLNVLMALLSDYSQMQQMANAFSIGRLPAGKNIQSISNVDGAAIPYRYKLTFNMQYAVTSVVAVQDYTSFSNPTVSTNQ